ncbi:MAG: 2-oxoglutarate dehydrogenase complex dihydrolipoyllysine-residue succinyltransferase [Gammaproteobacteria bacterium]|nr:MAG: 2-oxoglutarate dehydrogenase complex dihydrolipoyllysine-residue succinyltransferase [Gammaproteobacteria bacterium]
MSTEVRVPQLPESVADATLVVWHRQPGERVNRDENLADLETDKVVLEVPAPVSGVLKAVKVEAGTTVVGGDLLAIIEEGEGGKEPAGKLSPAARRLAGEHGLEAAAIAGSGRDGRVSKADVAVHLERAPAATPVPPAVAVQSATPVTLAAAGGRVEQRVPMTRLRARIAERLVAAQATQAMLTTFNEIDMHALSELRTRHREAFEQRHGVRLGYMSFFVKACIEALRRFPVVNAAVDGNDIVYHEYFDIGVAVSTERGLLVPVIRDADQKSFADLEKAVSGFGERARDGTITLEELTGGTFSVTNGGVFGSLLSTPIVNAPQSAILGMHKIQQRPVAVGGQVVVRPMMYVALSYDHRIIDGREAVQFLVAVKDALEDPARLLLQV